MQLILSILVLCWCLSRSGSYPTTNPESRWRKSRFIIDNRRSEHYSSKAFHDSGRKYSPGFRFSNETLNKRHSFPVDRYPKDLTPAASLIGTDFYQKYNEHSAPRRKPEGRPHFTYKASDFESDKNFSSVNYDPHNFLQAEEIQNQNDLEAREVVTSTGNDKLSLREGQGLTWAPKLDALPVSVISSTATTSIIKKPASFLGKLEQSSKVQGFEDKSTSKLTNDFSFRAPTTTTTTSFPWRLQKTEEGNLIDKNPGFLDTHEKHVYETRIETVSYHQEIIFNQGKTEVKQSNWYRPEVTQETASQPKEEKSYDVASERSYEKPEENYEEPEKNYEEPEINYEEPERNYEEPEKNYEVDEAVNVVTEGRVREFQPTDAKEEDNRNKFGYVVEGRNYRKYRVEERTPDGFIVGEYGVVSHDDGSLRGVRYTADGTTNPQLIYETLIKFLSL